MLTLILYGAELQLQDGSNLPLPPIGGTPVTGRYTLDTGARALQLVDVQGVLRDIEIKLTWRGTIYVSGNRATLASTADSNLWAKLRLPDRSTRVLPNPAVRISTDTAVGLEIADRNGEAFRWLNQPIHRPARWLSFNFASLSTTLIAIDLRQSRATHRPAPAGGPKLDWFDSFAYQQNPAKVFRALQQFSIVPLTFLSNNC